MNKKKIIFFSVLDLWSLGNKKGGMAFSKTIKGYVNYGWDVTIVIHEDAAKNREEFPGAKFITFTTPFDRLSKIPKIRFLFRYLKTIFIYIKMLRLGSRLLTENKRNTILYAYEIAGVLAAKKLSRKFDLPLVCRFQGTVLNPVKDNFWNRFLYYPHFQALKIKADLIIMTNDGTFGDRVLHRLGNETEKILFWRNGIDFDLFSTPDRNETQNLRHQLGIIDSEKMLLTVSRLVEWKRVDRAIVGLNNLVKKYPNCKLVIVGDGPEKENLINLVKDLNLNNQVIFTGSIPHSKVVLYMHSCDVFLSLYDLSNAGNPLLEAMVCGKPIVTINTGDTASLIQNGITGMLIEKDDVGNLANYLYELLTDEELARKLGKSAKNYADLHFWSWEDRIMAEINEVEKNLINESN